MHDSKLVEQLEDVIQQECSRRTLMEGGRYASPMEGYGDLTAELQTVEEELKQCRKEYRLVLGRIREADSQALYEKLLSCRVTARTLAAYATKMAAVVERNIITAQYLSGGDLFDRLEEDLDDESEDE